MRVNKMINNDNPDQEIKLLPLTNGVRIQYILKRELGTVVLTTGIYGKKHQRQFDSLSIDFHTTWDYLESGNGSPHCEFLDGDCYSDGSGLLAEQIWEEVEKHGEWILWKELQEFYEHCTAIGNWKPFGPIREWIKCVPQGTDEKCYIPQDKHWLYA